MGKFILKQTKTGFRFDLKAVNGEIIASGEVYAEERGCRNGIESVRKCCTAAIEDQTVKGFQKIRNPKYEIYKDAAGQFRFRLKARNGEIIAVSEGYKAKASCQNGIASVRKNAPDAPVVRLDPEA